MCFWRFTKGQTRPATRMSDIRPVNTLRALDGHLSGASYRAIAECLFGSARLLRRALEILLRSRRDHFTLCRMALR